MTKLFYNFHKNGFMVHLKMLRWTNGWVWW